MVWYNKAVMIYIEKEKLDIKKIALSGQCFRIRRSADPAVWEAQALDRFLLLRESEDAVGIDCSEAEFAGFWKDYFDLDTDYGAIEKSIDPDDKFLTAAAEYSRGIRILRQDPWEMLITFIISQRKNIPAITSCVEKISAEFGSSLGEGRFAFPTPQQLAEAGEALSSCSLGYRDRYVENAAKLVASKEVDLYAWNSLPDEELTEKLLSFYGVGIKVANCVKLFGYHRINAFPIDVWIKRVIDEKYGGSFSTERYEGFAGIIQQFMFFYGRNTL